MRYQIEGDDLCIRITLDAIAQNVETYSRVKVVDKHALAMSVGRELCECEDMGGDFYLSRTLDNALERVVESADKSLSFPDLE